MVKIVQEFQEKKILKGCKSIFRIKPCSPRTTAYTLGCLKSLFRTDSILIALHYCTHCRLLYSGQTMSTAAWTTVCLFSADGFLWLVPMWDQPFCGRPNKIKLAFQILLLLTGQGITLYSFNTYAFIFLCLLFAGFRTTTANAAELLPYIPYIMWL